MRQGKKPELLIPAASLEVLKTAVIFGADAVYIGGDAFGLRAKAKNFTLEEMAEGIAFAHAHGVKVYVTANILAHNGDLEGAAAYFGQLRDMKPEPCDALIVSDPGMFAIVGEVWPEAEIHISTQANNTNYGTFRFWWKQGAKRVVAARELSLREIKEIREKIPEEMEIECFVHGAMCISYSGRCLLSNYFTGRDANQGSCTHPCRWKYAVAEETRPGEYLPVEENERGTFIFNSKDLCMIEHIPELLEAGIDSLKIEGRMKTALYVATVARTYRRAIDDFWESEEKYLANMDWYKEEIGKCTHRYFSTGFYFGKPGEEAQIYDSSTYVNEYIYLGIIDRTVSGEEVPWKQEGSAEELPWMQEAGGEEVPWKQEGDAEELSRKQEADGKEVPRRQEGSAEELSRKQETGGEESLSLAMFEQRNKFSVGDVIEIMKPDGRNIPVRVKAMYDEEGVFMESCPHARQKVWAAFYAVDENSQKIKPEDERRGGCAVPERYDLMRVKKGE